jgi:hypothetical protein
LPTLAIINKEATIDLKDLAKALRRIEDEVLEDATGEALKRLTKSRLSYAVEPDTYLRTSPVRCELPKLDLYLQPHRRAFHVEYRWLPQGGGNGDGLGLGPERGEPTTRIR